MKTEYGLNIIVDNRHFVGDYLGTNKKDLHNKIFNNNENYVLVGEYLYINLYCNDDDLFVYSEKDSFFVSFGKRLENFLKYKSLGIEGDILEMVYNGWTEDYEAYRTIELSDFIKEESFIRINLNELKEKENK